jgi:hypothetical protein
MRCWNILGVALAFGCGPNVELPPLAEPGEDTAADTADDTGSADEDDGPGTKPEPLRDVPAPTASCNQTSAEALSTCVERSAYLSDLEFIADIRVPGTTHWQAVQDLCFDRLAELGYAPELQVYETGVNVIGRKIGLVAPQEEVVLAAHYDHIGDCLGADDNASGVAGVLEVARALSGGRFEKTLVVACWDQEEVGLVGSRVFATAAAEAGTRIAMNFNLEMIGYKDDASGSQTIPPGFDLVFPEEYAKVKANDFRADFVAFVADDLAHDPVARLRAHAERIGLPNAWLELSADLKLSPLVGDLQRSDHASFWALDFPAVMITDTSNFRYANYHCNGGQDSVDQLDHDFSTAILETTTAAVADTLVLAQ